MLNDPYSPCPCGSGKKFKWCCQPIHTQIAKVYAMDQEGQHEASLRAMDEVVAEHPANPEALGRKAQLLFQNDRVEEAEKTLDKAFELFPNYPFGFFLKARFRLFEGNMVEALAALRKSAEHYDPTAADILAQIYVEIFDCEMKLNHPLAGHAAILLALKFDPANDSVRQGVTQIFGDENPNLPASARQRYAFLPLPAQATPERLSAWEKAIQGASTGKLGDAVKAFETLTQGDGVEPAAWFNLALSHAWIGNNVAAVDALERYVTAEPDEQQAASAWALAEVLRYGQGMEDQADVVEHAVAFALRDPRAFVAALGEIEKDGLLTGAQVNREEGMLTAVVLEAPPAALTPELEARQNMRIGAYIALVSNIVRLWNANKDALDRVFAMFQQKLGDNVVEAQPMRSPAKFVEAISESITVPRAGLEPAEALARVQEGFEKYFEETWIHRPLKSLRNVAPIDAVGSPVLRKKLRGLLKFVRECASVAKHSYDFDRLERKLGLFEGAAAAAKVADGTQQPDIGAMSAADLAALQTEPMGSPELDQAFQSALQLDARELAGKFAAQLVERPPYAERSDRFPLYQLLINQAMNDTKLDDALDYLNDGERDDCEQNEGKRRNEYELRRAQVHAKRSEFADAERVYDGLIARVPTELKYRVNAAETMLSGRQADKALKYAKDGLAEALKQNNRDMEGAFKEMMAAAQRK